MLFDTLLDVYQNILFLFFLWTLSNMITDIRVITSITRVKDYSQ